MTDKELLELAAKAAGIEVTGYDDIIGLQYVNGSDDSPYTDYWNPLESDADALRLAVKLGINKGFGFAIGDTSAIASTSGGIAQEENIEADTDPYAATRRAIVRAAAEIGRAM